MTETQRRAPDALDGPVADPDHHHVLFENDEVRVVETRIPAGVRSPVHTHHRRQVQYFLSGSHFCRRDPSGVVLVDSRAIEGFVLPRVQWSDGTPAHTLENTGSRRAARDRHRAQGRRARRLRVVGPAAGAARRARRGSGASLLACLSGSVSTAPRTPSTTPAPERLFDQLLVAGPRRGGRRLRPRHRHGPPQPDPGDRPAGPPDARGVVDARRARPRDEPRAAGPARHRRHVPQPGAARQDRDDARRPVRRPGGPRARRRMVRGGARRRSGSRSRRSASAWTGWTRRSRSPAACSPRSGRRSRARYSRTDDVLNVPRPVQAGGPPILVGGGGEQRTLRIAAKHADMTHWFPIGLEALAHKTDVLRGYCEAIGRDPDEIERTMAAPVIVARDAGRGAIAVGAAPAGAAATTSPARPSRRPTSLRPYLDAGFTGFTFNNNVYPRPEQIAAHRGAAAARRLREAVPVPRRPGRRHRRPVAARDRPPRRVDRLRRARLSPTTSCIPFGFVPLLATVGRGHRAAAGRAVRGQQRPAPPGAAGPGPRDARRAVRRARRGGDRRRLEPAGVRRRSGSRSTPSGCACRG